MASGFRAAIVALISMILAIDPTVGATVVTPGDRAPAAGVVYGAIGATATAVTGATPLPVTDTYRASVPIVVGTNQTPQRAVLIAATGAGNVVIRLADDSLITVPIVAGLTLLPMSAKTVVASGTTATATYYNLS